jgi:hypothetical protein
MATPEAAAQIEIARPRRSAGKVRRMIARVVGMMVAAKTPIKARMAMMNHTVVGRPASAAVTAKPTRPSSRVRRRPKRSPMEPAMSRKPANVRV